MGLQISEFSGSGSARGAAEPLPDGPPLRVSNVSGATYTVGTSALLIRIKGTGSITWAGVATAEDFDGIEYRLTAPGAQFAVA